MEGATVIESIAWGQAFGDELLKCGPAGGLAVIVGAGAAGEEAEAVSDRRERGTERIGNAGFEPADCAGAEAAENGAVAEGFAENFIEAVRAPDGEEVDGVSTADVDHVLFKDKFAEIPWFADEKWKVGRNAILPGKGFIKAEAVIFGISTGGWHETDARPGRSREGQYVIVQERNIGFH